MPKPGESVAGGAAAGDGYDPDAAPHGALVHVPAMSPPVAPPNDRKTEARREAGVGLADDLRSVRTALDQACLSDDFEADCDRARFQTGRLGFTTGYKRHALDIAFRETADRPKTRMNDADPADSSPGEAVLEDRSDLSLDRPKIVDDGESFAALRALPASGTGSGRDKPRGAHH